MSGLPPAIRGARAAFVFLTRLPLGGYPYSDEAYAWAPAHGPLVGLVVGGLGATAAVLCLGAGAMPAVLVGLAVTMLVTGGFHEDGLADTADALGGAIFDRGKLLEILKDSRIGTYGALALVLSVGLRAALLCELAAPGRLHESGAWGLVLAMLGSHVFARVGPVWLMALMPYVTDEAHARSRPIVRAGVPQALVASAHGAALLVAGLTLVPNAAFGLVVAFSTIVPVSAFAAWRFHARAGGITGDFLGAQEQCCEVAVLLALALAS